MKIITTLLFVTLPFAPAKKISVLINTSCSNGSKYGTYYHGGEAIGPNKIKFIQRNERLHRTDTVIITILR